MNRESTPDTDSDLLRRATEALAQDGRTAEASIEVIAQGGLVTLEGEVESLEVRHAAEQITAAQPGVIEVINDLGVIPGDRDEDRVDVDHFAYHESRPPVIPEQDIDEA